MDDDALLKRIDRRLEVTEGYVPQIAEYIRQGNEHMREGNRQLQEFRVANERHAQAFEDLRIAIDQWNLRQEKMMREVLAGAQELTASIRAWRYEGVEEARAQRAALFAILDELKGRGPATA
jgi:predicted  nucleic acid-binding Zn-ribbon protein